MYGAIAKALEPILMGGLDIIAVNYQVSAN